MAEPLSVMAGAVERLPVSLSSSAVTDELNKIIILLQKSCPEGAAISFDFDGRLHVHIDVRKQEEVTLVQAILPALGMGLFNNVSRGNTPHRPFFHRISATVAR